MPVLRFLQALAVLAGVSLATIPCHAQVWRCMDNGRTVFSDVPCPNSGRELDPHQLNANTVQGHRAPAARESAEPASAPARPTPSEPTRTSVCPTDQDIRNMEVKASSITLRDKEKDFLNDEIRRARQCRKGQGNYSAADWQASRDAQEAQSSLEGRERARRTAEGVHSAADPIEGDRIERRQQQARQRERQPDRPRRQDDRSR